MLKEISIENFKAFGKKQIISLKPITLLYGPNSSGKSSLIQALLLFKQTLESMNKNIVLQPRGNYVDLGGYAEFINDHDTKKNFSFGVGFSEYSSYFYVYDTTVVCAKRSLEYTFCNREEKEIAIESLSISDSLLSAPVTIYKQMMNFSDLRNTSKQEGKSRSVLVRESMDLQSESYRNATYYPSFQCAIDTEYESNVQYLKKEIQQVKKTIHDLKRTIREADPLNPGPREEENRLVWCANFEPPESKEEWYQRKKAEGQSELLKQERALAVLQKIYKALTNKSFDQFSKISGVAFDSLVSLTNCFPEALMTGREGLFKNVEDPLLLGSLHDSDSSDYHMLPTTWILAASELFRLHLNDLWYIGPLRAMPERLYPFSGNLPSDVGIDGRYAPDILIARPDIVAMINQWFTRFDLNYSLKIDHITRDYYEISLIDKMTGSKASVKDVGFGISQIVPIIVQGLMAENKILCIEQPEIHLHPRLQAELADFFIPITKERDDCNGSLNQVIIETHSEHLILRLLRRIRETTNGELEDEALALRPDQVAVIYAKPTENGTELTELRMSEDGDFIDKWPDGFFTEREKELF